MIHACPVFASPGFTITVFPIVSCPMDSCTWPHTLSVGCVSSIIFLTAQLPTRAPDSILSAFVSNGGACVTRIVKESEDNSSEYLLKLSYKNSSEYSLGVSNGVGFEPPNPMSFISPIFEIYELFLDS